MVHIFPWFTLFHGSHNGQAPKPLYEKIASPYSGSSPYSRENPKKFILVSIKSLVQGDKPACKVCKINREISLISLHVAKNILCQKVSADVCGFCGTNCNSSLALRLSSGSKAKDVKTLLFGHMV